MKKGSDTLLFHYDESGSPIMMRMNGTPYTYVKNLQGDIVGLIDSTGALIVEYKYDAWGNPISTRTLTSAYDALAELNPFRYRGYVWDTETGFCYVSSRYYNSEIRRFISADVLVSTGQGILGNNMYAYCRNNPVCRKDIAGTVDVEIFEPDTNPLDDDELIAGGKMASANKNAVYSEPHGNSQFSTRPQHGYIVRNISTGDTVKVGISGGNVTKFGISYRATSQVNKWNLEAGSQTYESLIVIRNMPNRRYALDWERDYANQARNSGNSMIKHKRP